MLTCVIRINLYVNAQHEWFVCESTTIRTGVGLWLTKTPLTHKHTLMPINMNGFP